MSQILQVQTKHEHLKCQKFQSAGEAELSWCQCTRAVETWRRGEGQRETVRVLEMRSRGTYSNSVSTQVQSGLIKPERWLHIAGDLLGQLMMMTQTEALMEEEGTGVTAGQEATARAENKVSVTEIIEIIGPAELIM